MLYDIWIPIFVLLSITSVISNYVLRLLLAYYITMRHNFLRNESPLLVHGQGWQLYNNNIHWPSAFGCTLANWVKSNSTLCVTYPLFWMSWLTGSQRQNLKHPARMRYFPPMSSRIMLIGMKIEYIRIPIFHDWG